MNPAPLPAECPSAARLPVRTQAAAGLRLALALGLAVLLAAGGGNVAWADYDWDFRPYKVLVWVALADTPGTPPALFDPLARRIRDRAESECGATWDLEVAPAPPPVALHLAANPAGSLAALLGEDLPAADKLMLLALAETDGGLQVSCRELDIRTRRESAARSRVVRQRELWAEAAFELVRDTFAPLVRVDRTTDNTVLVHPKAWRLVVDPASPARIRPGELLTAVTRRNDSHGQAKAADIQPIPWTILVAREETTAGVRCDLYSGIRGPLASKTSVRTERLAVVARPEHPATRLTLVSRTDVKTPLAGYEILVQPPPPPAAGEAAPPAAPPQSLGRTDWRGQIELPAQPGHLVLLHVKSGRETLVRLPLAPGLTPEIRLPVTDDGPRLAAEGYLLGVQESIIDLIARRQVLALRIRKLLAERQIAAAEKLMAQLDALPTRDKLRPQISSQQQRYVTPDERVKARIQRLFDETLKLIDAHLAPQLLQDLSGELNRARQGG